MAVVVARMIAELSAETSSFHARMTAAETQITKWSGATASGTRATRILNNSLQQLSFQAAGIPGPIGKVASAIGVLGIGGGPVMLAVAALGALALVWKELDAAATLAADNVVAAANRMQRNLSAAAGRATPDAIRASLTAAQANLDSLRAAPLGAQRYAFVPGVPVPPVPTGTPAGDRAAEIQAAESFVRQLTVMFNTLPVEKIEAFKAKEMALRLTQIQFQQGQNAMDRMTFLLSGMPSRFQPPAFGVSGEPQLGGPATFANIRRNQPRFVGETGSAAKMDMLQVAQMASASVMMAAQGGAGGALAGAGGFAAGMSGMAGISKGTAGALGWAGLALSTIGGLFSLFEDKASERELAEERRHKELIGALHEGPARISVISADDPEADLYALRHQERMGGEPRLGGL